MIRRWTLIFRPSGLHTCHCQQSNGYISIQSGAVFPTISPFIRLFTTLHKQQTTMPGVVKRRLPTIGQKSKRKKMTKQAKAAQTKLYEEAVESVCSQSQSQNSSLRESQDASTPAESTGLNRLSTQMLDLLQLVKDQQKAITLLTDKLSTLMAFLGLSNATVAAALRSDIDSVLEFSYSNSAAQLPAHQTDDINSAQLPPLTQPAQHTQTKPGSIITQNRVASLKGAIRQTVLSTVYVNQLIKEKRANSVVIKGLDIPNDQPINTMVARFLFTELQVDTDIKYCKRLGRPTAGRVQPLLVVLSTVDEASVILARARDLRHSPNPYTKECIYIGPNLTASEAQAEYQLRCRRRQREAQQTTSSTAAAAGGPAVSRTARVTTAVDRSSSSRTVHPPSRLVWTAVGSAPPMLPPPVAGPDVDSMDVGCYLPPPSAAIHEIHELEPEFYSSQISAAQSPSILQQPDAPASQASDRPTDVAPPSQPRRPSSVALLSIRQLHSLPHDGRLVALASPWTF